MQLRCRRSTREPTPTPTQRQPDLTSTASTDPTEATMSKRNPMPDGRWEQALAAAGYRCLAACYRFGSTRSCAGRLVVHHKALRGMGGTRDPAIHDLDNLAVLCDVHHREVHDRPQRAYECGLMLRRTTTNEGENSVSTHRIHPPAARQDSRQDGLVE